MRLDCGAICALFGFAQVGKTMPELGSVSLEGWWARPFFVSTKSCHVSSVKRL